MLHRELDALVAERVMGLMVVAHDWPCGHSPDGCGLEASSFLPVLYGGFDSPGPVIAADDDGWPPKPDPEVEGGVYAFVEPVPFYSTDIAAAWEVVEKLQSAGLEIELCDDAGSWQCLFLDYPKIGRCKSNTAPRAICLAALEAVGVGVKDV